MEDAQIRDSISEAAPPGDTSKSSPEAWLPTLEAQRWPLTQGSEMDLRYKPPSLPHRQGSPPLGSPPSGQQSEFTEHCLHWGSVSAVSIHGCALCKELQGSFLLENKGQKQNRDIAVFPHVTIQ